MEVSNNHAGLDFYYLDITRVFAFYMFTKPGSSECISTCK